MHFKDYNISGDIKDNLERLGFKKPTDIQFKAIPSIISGEDVLAIAQTGTGKTAAFAIPVINKIHTYKTSKRSLGIKCIVLVPTRELALQIGEVFTALSRHTKVITFTLHGGVEQDLQIKTLQNGIDVLIATPGRMFDLISQGYIQLTRVSTLVLDEADHMLDLGFIEDIKYIKKKLTTQHQTLFFSATINPEIKKLAFSQVKSSAIRIQISPDDPVSKNISHFVQFVEMDDKRFALEKFLRDNPKKKVIVFVRTRVRAERVVSAMERVNIHTIAIHGEKDQKERSKVMSDFKAGRCSVLIATDVSARGIDIPNVHFVINYDLPEKPENYVHRIGRTGRGDQKGSAIAYCSSEERPLLEAIQTFITKKIAILPAEKPEDNAPVEYVAKDQTIAEVIAEHDAWILSKTKKGKWKKT